MVKIVFSALADLGKFISQYTLERDQSIQIF